MNQSPATAPSKVNNQTVDVKKSQALPTPRKKLPADAVGEYDLFGYFAYANGAAQPGDNILTISLSPNVWIVSAFPTEVEADGTPHVGDAHFNIESVELDTHGEICPLQSGLGEPAALWGHADHRLYSVNPEQKGFCVRSMGGREPFL